MKRQKITTVWATTDAPAPSEELRRAALDDNAKYAEWSRQMDAHKKHFQLYGHWTDETATNYALRHGCKRVESIERHYC